jgi:hypothetical protein
MRGVGKGAEDPGLPIKFGPCSNGEFVPPPLSAVEREAIRLAHLACDDNARSVGMSRRQFLFTASAAATTLLTLQGCFGDSGGSKGGRYRVPAEAGRTTRRRGRRSPARSSSSTSRVITWSTT